MNSPYPCLALILSPASILWPHRLPSLEDIVFKTTMSSAAAAAAEIAALEPTIIAIGYDLLSTKRYWVAITALWSYEYILTLGNEIQYAWKGRRNLMFWLFFLNRYLCLIIIIITNVAYFTPLFTQELETLFMATIAEVLVLLRVHALSGRKQYVLSIAILLIVVQWALLLYQDVLYKNGTSNLAVLLFARELDTSAIPPLPDIDAYRLCIAIPSTQIAQAGETFLSLFIVYDGLAVLSIIYFVSQQAKGFHFVPILELVQRDGLLYFAVMFSSNFVWLMMALHARPSLGFIQNQPAMVISSIMVNRITMNLQKASEEKLEFSRPGSSRRGAEDENASTSENDIELGSFRDSYQTSSRRFSRATAG
ncbi:hypothetical protein DFH05DRAFT_1544383 [Lentinula detonsa]|uniref:DUF6533 domain-containing protein n=1 Tax=Lentinula detonsa TaxID=2804962 RepID=A0A9W8NWM2_9AGAR|nr:hypothetical protein DFH05DRAFT_1544383 [Lentinula detonsa]